MVSVTAGTTTPAGCKSSPAFVLGRPHTVPVCGLPASAANSTFARQGAAVPTMTKTTGTKVKICGITSVDDAHAAIDCGAWAIGLIFYPESPRRCELEQAAAIATAVRKRVEVAGVFVNAPLDELLATVESVPLTILQLHGDEGPSYCDEARRRTGLRVIKAVRARDASAVRALSAYRTDFHMLDAYVAGSWGGTGERFDWELASAHPGSPPLLLSGGLDARNVGEAIEVVRPFAVDVASGVEAEPGRKDHDELRRFFAAVEGATARV
jgi:phosphoribosylanthranilate isomerase